MNQVNSTSCAARFLTFFNCQHTHTRTQGIEDAEDSEEDGLSVGPAPPDLIEEDNAMPEDAREAEVCGVCVCM